MLDIMMPGKDGYEICKTIRKTGNTVPIIFLTAMDREFDEIKGLDAGGDDYIRNPLVLSYLSLVSNLFYDVSIKSIKKVICFDTMD